MRTGILTIAGVAAMLASAAQGQAAAVLLPAHGIRAQAATNCTPDDGYLTGPRAVAGGRPVELTLQQPLLGRAHSPTVDVDGVTDGAAWDGPPSPVPGSPGSWTVSGIEGTVRFTVDYVGNDGCPQSKHIDIEAVPARVPRPFADVATYGSENSVELGVESGDSAAECAVMTPDPITVTIASGRVRQRAQIADPCSGWSTRRHRRRATTFVINYSDVTDDHASLVWLQLRGRKDGRRVRFRYSLAWHGRTLRRGSIVGVTRYQAPHQVWLGTDAFVNYCINENKQTYSGAGTSTAGTTATCGGAGRSRGRRSVQRRCTTGSPPSTLSGSAPARRVT